MRSYSAKYDSRDTIYASPAIRHTCRYAPPSLLSPAQDRKYSRNSTSINHASYSSLIPTTSAPPLPPACASVPDKTRSLDLLGISTSSQAAGDGSAPVTFPRHYTHEEQLALAVTSLAQNEELLGALAWRLGIPRADVRPDGREPPLARGSRTRAKTSLVAAGSMGLYGDGGGGGDGGSGEGWTEGDEDEEEEEENREQIEVSLPETHHAPPIPQWLSMAP